MAPYTHGRVFGYSSATSVSDTLTRDGDTMKRLIAALALTLASASVLAESMYQWTDDRGRVQYGQQPPADRPYQRLDIRAAPSPGAPVRSTQPAQPEKAEPAKQAAGGQADEATKREQEAKRAADCAKLRANLVTLSDNPRLSRHNAEGEVERIGEDERQQMITEAKQNLATYCQDQ